MIGGNIQIEEFAFDKAVLATVKSEDKCSDWPVVYLIHGKQGKSRCPIYIGETSNFIGRFNQHLADPNKHNLYSIIKVVINNRYNKSAILDVEQSLIRLFKCDPQFDVQNKNLGQSSHHDYYQRFTYVRELETLWTRLNLSGKSFLEITSSDTYKFSPYTALTVEQRDVCFEAIDRILDSLEGKEKGKSVQVISGAAGTGKSVVAIKILSLLLEANTQPMNLSLDPDQTDSDDSFCLRVQWRLLEFVRKRRCPIKVAYVVAMTSLRETLQKVFKETLRSELKANGISAGKLVIGPTDVAREKYDVLIVDEAHRLQQRRNISWLGTFDATTRALDLNSSTATTLDWILKQSKCQILFYDAAQSVRPADISALEFQKKIAEKGRFEDLALTTQMRCEGGASYVEYIDEILRGTAKRRDVKNYDFRLYEHFAPMLEAIQSESDDSTGKGFSRVVAGYAWKWNSKNDKKAFDIQIEGKWYRWNSQLSGWITSPNAVREIGCVHTTQGFDLAYVGVIIGPDIHYDSATKKIIAVRDKSFDTNMKNGISRTPEGDEEFLEYVINCYKVMLTRGIRGCFVYAFEDSMREYLKQFIPLAAE